MIKEAIDKETKQVIQIKEQYEGFFSQIITAFNSNFEELKDI